MRRLHGPSTCALTFGRNYTSHRQLRAAGVVANDALSERTEAGLVMNDALSELAKPGRWQSLA